MRNLILATSLTLFYASGAFAASPVITTSPVIATSRISVVVASGEPLRAGQQQINAASTEQLVQPEAPRRKVRVILGSPYGN